MGRLSCRVITLSPKQQAGSVRGDDDLDEDGAFQVNLCFGRLLFLKIDFSND